MSNRTFRAISGFFADSSWSVVLTITNFIITPIIIGLLTPEQYGYWLTVVSIVAYLGLADFGCGIALVKMVSDNEPNQQNNSLSDQVSTGFISLCIISLFCIIIGFFISGFLSNLLGFSTFLDKELSIIILIIIIGGSLSMPLSIFSATLTGLQYLTLVHTVKSVTALFGVGLSIILLYSGVGLKSMAFSYLFEILASGGILYFFIRKKSDIKIRFSYFDLSILKKLLSFGGYFQIGKIANSIALSTDNIIISASLGPALVTPYALTAKLAILFSVTIPSKIPNALFPGLSQLLAEGNIIRLREIFLKLSVMATRIGIVGAAIVYFVNEPFVGLWVGKENYGGFGLSLVFVGWVLLDSIYRSIGGVLYAIGDLKPWAFASIIEALLNLALSLILIKTMGLIGVAVATLAARSVTGIIVPVIICRRLKLLFSTYCFDGILIPLIKSIPGIGLVWLFARFGGMQKNWLWIGMIISFLCIINILSIDGIKITQYSVLSFKQRLQKVKV